VSNPPYVAVDDPVLEASVRDWEPSTALFSGGDGLDDVRHVVAGAPVWLRPDGWLVLEIGSRQGDAVGSLLTGAGFVDVEVRPDLAGHDRMVLGRRP
jgi:release factor glutamine methyltransferase